MVAHIIGCSGGRGCGGVVTVHLDFGNIGGGRWWRVNRYFLHLYEEGAIVAQL